MQKLTEGIVQKSLLKETKLLVSKWEKVGLLQGLGNEEKKSNMAVMLENQAKELLREATTMESGDVEGFAAVAFPIVRRVFGGLLAQDLVSVQPMSLPAGLIFFMDFTTDGGRSFWPTSGTSLYGGNKVASGIADGVSISSGSEETGFYNLSSGWSSATSSTAAVSGGYAIRHTHNFALHTGSANWTEANKKLIRYDADLISLGDEAAGAGDTLYMHIYTTTSSFSYINRNHLMNVSASNLTGGLAPKEAYGNAPRIIRRLTTYDGTTLKLFITSRHTGSLVPAAGWTYYYPVTDAITTGTGTGAIVGTSPWPLEAESQIPEIQIKVDSMSITAETRKLKTVWSPELSQDMNAFHNMDAEVELTGIMSESIALEVDQEILHDLVVGAKAATFYWSRRPGLFVNRETGADLTSNGSNLPDFTGVVSEWYETLLETVNDVSADIHRKVLRGGATFIVCGPEVATILEFTHGFRAEVTGDEAKGSAGTYKTGTISKKWDLFVDPYFPRNVILVGRKGKGFLESGYVYAPYVPLQVTPVIYDPDNFTPRRGVATRYGKKLVRPDMYGLVIVRDLDG